MNIKMLEMYGKVVSVLGEQAETFQNNKAYWSISTTDGYSITIELSDYYNYVELKIYNVVSNYSSIEIDNIDKIYTILGYAHYHNIKVA